MEERKMQRVIAAIIPRHTVEDATKAEQVCLKVAEQLHSDYVNQPPDRRTREWWFPASLSNDASEPTSNSTEGSFFPHFEALAIFRPSGLCYVSELTDDLIKRFDAVVLYRRLTGEERQNVTGLTPAQNFLALFPDDIVAIIEVFFQKIGDEDHEKRRQSRPIRREN
jgi:hypothetical protein